MENGKYPEGLNVWTILILAVNLGVTMGQLGGFVDEALGLTTPLTAALVPVAPTLAPPAAASATTTEQIWAYTVKVQAHVDAQRCRLAHLRDLQQGRAARGAGEAPSGRETASMDGCPDLSADLLEAEVQPSA